MSTPNISINRSISWLRAKKSTAGINKLQETESSPLLDAHLSHKKCAVCANCPRKQSQTTLRDQINCELRAAGPEIRVVTITTVQKGWFLTNLNQKKAGSATSLHVAEVKCAK
jgi:hypothetical protein